MRFVLAAALCLAGILAGCQTCGGAAVPCDTACEAPEGAVMAAQFTSTPVQIDGKLDDSVWQKTHVYATSLAQADLDGGKMLQETGEVRLAWDDKNLYVAVRYHDSDIVQECDEDQAHHYLHGDLAEVFLKPAGSTWYWELYVTPNRHKTHLFFPGVGRLGLKSSDAYEMELHVDAQCQGTLNEWGDRDTSWTGEMAIPIKELTRHGDDFGPEAGWSILVARYNYSRYLPTRSAELSMAPRLPAASYHDLPNYAELRLEK